MAETSRDAPAPEAADLDKETRRAAGRARLRRRAGRAEDGRRQRGRSPTPRTSSRSSTAVQQAGELIVEDEYAAAAAAARGGAAGGPDDAPGAADARDACYSELGRTKEAKAQFDRVLKDDPQSVQALIGLASILLKEGTDRGRRRALQADALARRPQHPGLRAPRRGLHGPARSRRRRCPTSRRRSRSSPSSPRTA